MTKAEHVAARLGLTDPVVRRLRASGRLGRLELSEQEIRERLWQAHADSVGRKERRRPWLAPVVRDPFAGDVGGRLRARERG